MTRPALTLSRCAEHTRCKCKPSVGCLLSLSLPSQEDPDSKKFLADSEAQKWVKNTLKLSDVVPREKEFKAIFYPGGHGPVFDLPVDTDSQALIRSFYESGRPTAAVCHAPAVFVNVTLTDGKNILSGRRATAFTDEEEEQAGLTKAVPWLVSIDRTRIKSLADAACTNSAGRRAPRCLGDTLTCACPPTISETQVETTMKERGAQFEKTQPWGEKVIVDKDGQGRLLISEFHFLFSRHRPKIAPRLTEPPLRTSPSQPAKTPPALPAWPRSWSRLSRVTKREIDVTK